MAKRSKAAKRTKTAKKAAAKHVGRKAGKANANKMALGRGWRLTSKGGTTLSATLLAVHDLGDRYLAIFKSAA
ncbi:hypothetical protein [Bradyrhizobium vignae]|uniref:Uncharacterized protein n=1 Tax=Bradyrhizobium vignae TaxID=1549949 RepID=A0A2U3PUI0_9BRAD|nr:hypothetical protein [Bradyrhizobium vignae]SPP92784.1 conserved protein of unknown function [Bradyrhizobium vignae]